MFFKTALPVFEADKEKEMNYSLIFRETAPSLKGAVLYITAASFYRLSVNGSFITFGPARTAKGYARVDVIGLDEYDRDGENEIVIELTGYYCGSLATVKQPSFLQAELRTGDDVILATGRDFTAYRYDRRVQKTERYSVQRHFGEIWDYRVGAPFSADKKATLIPLELGLKYLPAPLCPLCKDIPTEGCKARGTFVLDENKAYRENIYSWKSMPEPWGWFKEDAVFSRPCAWVQRQSMTPTGKSARFPITLSAGEYALFDLGMIYAGFLSFSAEIKEDSNVVLAFTELCDDDVFTFTKMNCQNVIEYIFPGDTKENVMSFEPYTAKNAAIFVKSGTLTITAFGLTTYEHDPSRVIPRDIKDPALKEIYDAAVRSFTHNSLDIYMDCPSRERAGWLGDTFFTAQGEYYITGKSTVEDAFLENYRLYEYTGGALPRGVLPECYPSDFEGQFIPQWDMWYVLEVCQYLQERRPDIDKNIFKASIYDFLAFLLPYENADGLLQNLPSWNFVEWSRANAWVQDVSYPTNFLYAETLREAGRLYGDISLIERSDRVREMTKLRSWNGDVFIDNAVKDETGFPVNTTNFSEAGQYYAILFGDLDWSDPKYNNLKAYIEEDFERFFSDEEHFVRVNVWLGFYLKMWLFIRWKNWDRLAQMIKGVFPEMADKTGTLWEYRYEQKAGSYDHGFSAYVAYAIGMLNDAEK